MGVSCPAIPSARVIMSFQAQLNSVLAFEDGAESSLALLPGVGEEGAGPVSRARGTHWVGSPMRGGGGFLTRDPQRQDDNVQAFT